MPHRRLLTRPKKLMVTESHGKKTGQKRLNRTLQGEISSRNRGRNRRRQALLLPLQKAISSASHGKKTARRVLRSRHFLKSLNPANQSGQRLSNEFYLGIRVLNADSEH
jgi:hypothetical protein